MPITISPEDRKNASSEDITSPEMREYVPDPCLEHHETITDIFMVSLRVGTDKGNVLDISFEGIVPLTSEFDLRHSEDEEEIPLHDGDGTSAGSLGDFLATLRFRFKSLLYTYWRG